MEYKVHFLSGVVQFFVENNLEVYDILKDEMKDIIIFPKSKPMYENEDMARILEIKKYNLALLYIVDDNERVLYFTDVTFSKSKVKLKIR